VVVTAAVVIFVVVVVLVHVCSDIHSCYWNGCTSYVLPFGQLPHASGHFCVYVAFLFSFYVT